MRLSKEDWVLGAIDRLAVRRGVSQSETAALMRRAGLNEREAKLLAGHWFSTQYRHGLEWRREQYKESNK